MRQGEAKSGGGDESESGWETCASRVAFEWKSESPDVDAYVGDEVTRLILVGRGTFTDSRSSPLRRTESPDVDAYAGDEVTRLILVGRGTFTDSRSSPLRRTESPDVVSYG